MSRNDWERQGRRLHRWLGVVAVGFLFLSVGTGLLWANARFLYWPDHYKEKIHPLPVVALHHAKLSMTAIADLVRAAAGNDATLEQVTLKSDFGILVYEIKIKKQSSKRTVLLDAVTGGILSPLSDGFASQIARQYVRQPAAVREVGREAYTPRKKHTAVEAVRVSFDDSDDTEIILDVASGEIIEDEGRSRRLHFFVMQLHQLNFWGFEKTLLNVPGIPLLLMGVSGLVLWGVQLTRRRAQKALSRQQASHRNNVILEATERPEIV
jgi:uncharacterized membrane protein YkoI